MFKAMWYVAFFFSNLFRLKFKVFYLYFTDEFYRRDIKKIIGYLSQGIPKIHENWIPIYQLHLSHTIVYPDWVTKICRQIPPNEFDRDRWVSKHKIVVYKTEPGKYVVLNGNHRLQAIMKVYDPMEYLVVEEVTFPKKQAPRIELDRAV